MLGKRCRQDVYRGRDVPKPSSFGARRSFSTLLAFNDDGYTPKAERSARGLDMGMKNGAKLSLVSENIPRGISRAMRRGWWLWADATPSLPNLRRRGWNISFFAPSDARLRAHPQDTKRIFAHQRPQGAAKRGVRVSEGHWLSRRAHGALASCHSTYADAAGWPQLEERHTGRGWARCT